MSVRLNSQGMVLVVHVAGAALLSALLSAAAPRTSNGEAAVTFDLSAPLDEKTAVRHDGIGIIADATTKLL